MSPRRVPCVQLFCAALLISVAVAVAQELEEDGLDFDVDQLECTSSPGSGSGSDSGMAAAARGVQVKGQSGKFTLYDTSLGPGPQCDPDALTVTIDALYEVSADNKQVGSSGAIKHSINTFAAQAFEVGAAQPSEVGTAGVQASKVPFSTSIKGLGDARLSIDTYVFTASGEVGTPTERWAARPGDLKFNIVLSSWVWCGCGKGNKVEEGAFIDVVITVQREGGDAAPRGDNTVGLGDFDLTLSNQVRVDGEWMSMPTGYPLVELNGNRVTCTFRFPRFESEGFYDPLITQRQEAADCSEVYTCRGARCNVGPGSCTVAAPQA